jgi:hypothetical protein
MTCSAREARRELLAWITEGIGFRAEAGSIFRVKSLGWITKGFGFRI